MAPYCFADGRNKNQKVRGRRFEVRLHPFAVRTERTKTERTEIETSSFASSTRSPNFLPGKYFLPQRVPAGKLSHLLLPTRFLIWRRIQPEAFRGTPLGRWHRSMCCSEEAGYPGFGLLEFAEGSDKALDGPQRKILGAELRSLRVPLHATPREAILCSDFQS